MVRRPLAVLALAGAALAAGCRPATVTVAYAPAVGDRYGYRYEIEATITTARAGADPVVSHVRTELVVAQQVLGVTGDGARLSVRLARDGGTPRQAVVLVDRAGSVEGFALVEGQDAGLLGLGDGDVVGPSALTAPPDRPLAPGETWAVDDGDRHGEGRLERLGVVDGEDVAVVGTTLTEDVADTGRAGASATRTTGTLRSRTTTSYDLRDGAVRASTARAHGRLDAVLAPPAGVDAPSAKATVGYELVVRVSRTR